MLYNDYEMIIHALPEDQPYVNIYPFGDAHIGAPTCSVKQLYKWRKTVLSDPFGVVAVVGDVLDCSVKNSKGNCYVATMNPAEQKEFTSEFLYPLADKGKIICGTGGNHEYRISREVGTLPLYDVFYNLNISDLYRENMCAMKISVGQHVSDKRKQVAYGMIVTHGSSAAKHKKFTYGFDGCDLFLSGHTHDNNEGTKGKVKLDLHNNKVTLVPFEDVVITPFQEYGDYAIRGEYLPNFIDQYQMITLSGSKKAMVYQKHIG